MTAGPLPTPQRAESKHGNGSLTYGSGLFPILGLGGLISIYQFFNERANFCLAIWGGRCDYPPEYGYPFMLIFLLFVLSVLYGVWCLIRHERRHGMGAISGGFFSVGLFVISMVLAPLSHFIVP
jgi:hypothetical protein